MDHNEKNAVNNNKYRTDAFPIIINTFDKEQLLTKLSHEKNLRERICRSWNPVSENTNIDNLARS